MMAFNFGYLLVLLGSSAAVPLDQLCPYIPAVLCVRDVLKAIASETVKLNRTLNQLEFDVNSGIKVTQTFHRYVQSELVSVASQLPTFEHHQNFFYMNNIDQEHFVHLVAEAHDALSFYHNTIEEILHINEDFPVPIDLLWKKIRISFGKSGLICQYRSILRVYSREWLPIDRAGRVEFVKRGGFDGYSIDYDARSVLLARLVRESIRRSQNVWLNLETKFL